MYPPAIGMVNLPYDITVFQPLWRQSYTSDVALSSGWAAPIFIWHTTHIGILYWWLWLYNALRCTFVKIYRNTMLMYIYTTSTIYMLLTWYPCENVYRCLTTLWNKHKCCLLSRSDALSHSRHMHNSTVILLGSSKFKFYWFKCVSLLCRQYVNIEWEKELNRLFNKLFSFCYGVIASMYLCLCIGMCTYIHNMRENMCCKKQ